MSINQLSSVTPSDQIDSKQVKYMNKDYSEFKKNLVDFTKFYFPDTYQDFSDSSPGSIFIDMASYIGDTLSYYTDHSFRESLLAYAQETENIVSIAQGLGFKPKLTTPSFCRVSMTALVPADADGNLDITYLPQIAHGSAFNATTQNNTGTFLTADLVDFSNAKDREIKPYSLDPITSLPDTFLVIKRNIKVSSVTTKTVDVVVGSPEKFLKVQLQDDNAVEILSVTDAEGNVWYEVDNLSQDYRFRDTLVSARGSYDPLYILKPIKVNRRFITRLNRDLKLELVFGSGTGDLTDVWELPDYKSVYDEQYLQNMTNVALDTLNFTNSNSFGLAPGNTTLTIRYTVSNGISSNVPSNTITQIANLQTVNETRTFTGGQQSTFNAMISSITVTNDEPATGGSQRSTPEQIRQAAIGFVNAQGRVVTSADYEKRILSMPSKYGAVSKAFALRDQSIAYIIKQTEIAKGTAQSGDPDDDILYVEDSPVNNNINLYVLGYDNNRRLANLNSTVKQNIKKFLNGYRLLTDRVNIVDAFRVSIGVNYSITVYRGYNTYDVLARVSDSLSKYLDVDRWDINQPIVIDDIFYQIGKVDGVQTVNNLEIINKYQQKHGSDYAPYQYNISENTIDKVIYPSADPCIFELRYPQNDIVGTARQ